MRLRVLSFALTSLATVAGAGESSWPSPVPGFTPPKAGEHPRLFFRTADLPQLRERAKTPEGQAIIARCRQILGGGEAVRTEIGKFTLFDGAAFGFLYQITGDRKYAELARKAVEHAWEPGVVDRDSRMSLNPPNEPMRYGPSLAAVAMAYDLNYDAWPEDFRVAQAKRMQDHVGKCKKRGGSISLERMSLNPDNPNPVSNHLGLQVGGAGLTLLAIQGDPGTDPAKIAAWLAGVDKQARKVMTQDFGETGYFAEGPGPGVIATTWTFTPWLLAERVCAGRDWLSPRPQGLAAEWLSLRFVFQTILVDGKPHYLNPTPDAGYGSDWVQQAGGHHATAFCQGFGAIQPERKAAMKWVYEQFFQPVEAKQYLEQAGDGKPTYDIFTYPHRALFSLVNWPFDEAAKNPDKYLPKAIGDRHQGHFLFRNRWQDGDDTVVGVLYGHRSDEKKPVPRIMVWGLGQRLTFCDIKSAVTTGKSGQISAVKTWKPAADGSGIVAVGTSTVGVDFSRSSGADALIVVVGEGATGALGGGSGSSKAKATTVQAGGKTFAILTLSNGAHPEAKATGDQVVVGGQTIGFDGTAITFSKLVGPPTIAQ
ncbi:hypothetical protein LBMAG53_25560 [Planctomycetota bacterium]|nr:hypothetical protein LBMAG53_25560 [Planctomycetota bacterium]